MRPFNWPIRRLVYAALGVAATLYLYDIGYCPLNLAPWPSARAKEPINLSAEPTQVDLPEHQDPIVFCDRRVKALFYARAHYVVTGRVVANDSYYFDGMAPVSPVDVTLAWGPAAAPAMAKRITYSHFGRFGSWRYGGASPLPREEIESHVSNNHLIAKTPRLRAAIKSISVGDEVQLEGDLVDVDMQNDSQFLQWHTSLSRKDTGSGACEIIYVIRVRINDQIYE